MSTYVSGGAPKGVSSNNDEGATTVLILTRKVGESLKIGQLEDILDGPVTVTVLAVKGNQVRIGVEAQKNVRVDREEIRQRVDNNIPATYHRAAI